MALLDRVIDQDGIIDDKAFQDQLRIISRSLDDRHAMGVEQDYAEDHGDDDRVDAGRDISTAFDA
jgi:hypothetical protein